MNKNQGFTLIELLVVVLIIGILSSVALPQYQKAVAKSRYMQLMTTGDGITRAEEMFYLANGKYTNELDELDLEFPTSADFSIRLDVGEDTGHAAVNVVSEKWGMGHIVYFAHHNGPNASKRQCRVYTDTETETLHQVCKGLTGSDTMVKGKDYKYYLFQ